MPSNYRSMRNAAAGAFAATAARDTYRSAVKYGSRLLKKGNRSNRYRPRTYTARQGAVSMHTKRHNTDKLYSNVASMTLASQPVTMIAQGTGIGERERQLVRLRGFKVHYGVRNRTNFPVYNRLALIKFKYRSDSSTSPNLTDDFFRGQIGTRSIGFDSVANAQHLYDYAINTDKFDVLWDHKFICGGNGGNEEAQIQKFIDKFVPCNKLVHYDSTDLYSDVDGVFLVHWCSQWQTNSTTPVIDIMFTRGHCTTYFTDVI